MIEKERVIEEIMKIELVMFLTVNSQKTSSCQEYPESFRLHRRAQFSSWSPETVGSYLDDLMEAQGAGKNLMRIKYARMQGLIPSQNSNPIIDEIVRLQIIWQNEMFRKYPALMSNARPLTDEGESAQMTSFETYTRGELETYSSRTLKLLHADMLLKLEKGVNMSEQGYECLVRECGYKSLTEAEQRFLQRLEQQ
jgi:hypothetical protein